MTFSDFAPGTRFFADEGEPVSISPDGVLTNWFEGKPVVVPPSEFARTSPPSSLSFEDFSARVARYSEAKEAMKQEPKAPKEQKPRPKGSARMTREERLASHNQGMAEWKAKHGDKAPNVH